MEKENNDAKNPTARVYELGYLLVPTLPEEKLAEEVSKIKSEIESKGGIFISEEFPSLKTLTYKMSKVIETRKQKFEQAYFGWVKCEIDAEAIPELKSIFNLNANILRFILIKTVRESTLSFPKISSMKKPDQKAPDEGKVSEVVAKGPVNEEEIDKSIEELVIS